MEGDPLVQSYDKTLKLIIDEQKTLLSRGMNPDKYDRCKFQSRVQTDDDYPGKEGQVLELVVYIHARRHARTLFLDEYIQ